MGDWEDTTERLLGLGTNRRFNEVLKEYYARPLEEQLNSPIEYFMGPREPYNYVPPPWYKRKYYRLRANLKYRWRERLGYWIAGHTPGDDW
jgi:hypothetical protein